MRTKTRGERTRGAMGWGLACALALSAPGAQAGADPDPDYASRRAASSGGIDAASVRELVPLWSFSTGVLRGHEGAPLVVGGVVYLVTPFPNVVYALDLVHDGRVLWRYEPRQDAGAAAVMCCDSVSRGLGYGEGRLFLYQADGTLVALDARTGAPLWSVRNADPAKGETGTSAPLVVRDKVIVGMAGGEYGARGFLSAYDAASGALRWRAFSTGPDADMLIDPRRTTQLGRPVGEGSSLKSWEGDQWRVGGGAPWGRISYDAKLNLIYYGTGNPAPWNPAQRPGDNRWTAAIFARDVDTGVARWVYQTSPHDQWDYDAANEMILADGVVEGRARPLLTHFDRNGFVYILDRATGELLGADKFDPGANWARAIDLDPSSPGYGRPDVDPRFSPQANGEDAVTRGVCPATMGSKNANPAAYSPRTGWFYVPVIRLCMDFEPFHIDYAQGQPYTGADTTVFPREGGLMGALIAWDPSARRIAWEAKEPFPVVSGVLALSGGVVFYGTLEGYLKALDARTGEELYRFRTPSGVVGDPVAFSFEGRDYVAVLSGVGGWAGAGLAAGLTGGKENETSPQVYAALAKYTALGGALTVFGLR